MLTRLNKGDHQQHIVTTQLIWFAQVRLVHSIPTWVVLVSVCFFNSPPSSSIWAETCVKKRHISTTWRLLFSLLLCCWPSATVSWLLCCHFIQVCPKMLNKLTFFFVSGEALQCNCGGLKICSSPVETCHGPTDVCASIIFYAGTREWYGPFLWAAVKINQLKKQPQRNKTRYTDHPPSCVFPQGRPTPRAAWRWWTAWNWIIQEYRQPGAAGPTCATDEMCTKNNTVSPLHHSVSNLVSFCSWPLCVQ